MTQERDENLVLREIVRIYELIREVVFQENVAGILDQTARGALLPGWADEISILLPTRELEELRVEYSGGMRREGLLGIRIPVREGIAGWVALNRQSLTLEGSVSDPRFKPRCSRSDILFSMSIPIPLASNIAGVLNINATRQKPPFVEDYLRAVSALGQASGMALERVDMLEKLAESERQFRTVIDDAVAGVFQTTPEGQILYVNQSFARILGYDSPEQLVSCVSEVGSQLYFESGHRLEFKRQLQEKGRLDGFEAQMRQRDGSAVWVSISARTVQEEESGSVHYEGTIQDITDRKRAEEAVKDSEEKFRGLLESAPDAIVVTEESGRIVMVNAQTEKMFLYSREELAGQEVELLMPETLRVRHVESRAAYVAHSRPRPMGCGMDLVAMRKDGSKFPVEISLSPLILEHARLVSSAIRDISQRKETERMLQRSEERYRKFFGLGLTGIFSSTPGGRLVGCNAKFAQLLGLGSPEEAAGSNLLGAFESAGPFETLLELLKTEGRLENLDLQLQRQDGKLICVMASLFGEFDEAGELAQLDGFVIDITQRKELENQLRQAQKLEVVGRMAGGVGHDFGNLINIITGYTELLLKSPDLAEPQRKKILEIHDAGQRAATLTRQLLAFSRQQPVEPRVLNLNRALSKLEVLLRRLVGESIDLVTRLDPGLAPVRIDPGQLEQVVMNLCINARDAMSAGGRLTLETGNVELDAEYVACHPTVSPGAYVVLSVRDNGCGMDRETMSRIFEPFFTTKPNGQGTGLGLATVYGIVHQNGGRIEVFSELKQGTLFKIYLPVAAGEEEASEKAAQQQMEEHLRGDEVILLAEDQEALRRLVVEQFERYGYRVLQAGNGVEALAVAENFEGTVHLLVTDMVMPQLGGRELAQQLSVLRPQIKVLYCSGYPGDAEFREGTWEHQPGYLQKPFTMIDLVRRVRDLLDRAGDDPDG